MGDRHLFSPPGNFSLGLSSWSENRCLSPIFILLAVTLFGGCRHLPSAGPSAGIAELAGFSAPPGWSMTRQAKAPDPWIRMVRGGETLKIRLLGGEGSAYVTPAAFLSGTESLDLGKPARKLSRVRVSGRRTRMYRRRYLLETKQDRPAGVETYRMAEEEFCIVPAGPRFLLLSYSREVQGPAPVQQPASVWRSFLADFRLKVVH